MTFNAPSTSYAAPLTKPTNGLATAALVLGIVAAAGALVPFVNIGSMIIAIVGAVLGSVALARARTVQVGLVRAWFGIILSLATIPVALVVTAATTDVLNEVTPGSITSAGVEQPGTAPEPEAGEPDETVAQAQARISAATYLATAAFSRTGLLEQLDYEGFTAADAEHGVKSLSVDWDEQAALSAASYLEMGGFSREGLIDQLVYEGFTPEQAEHGVDQVGL
jgi:hypothetical protein